MTDTVASRLYVDLSDERLLAIPGALIILAASETDFNVAFVDGVDLFQPGCVFGQLQGADLDRQHPLGSYNISYPYCRTAFKFRMDDPKANPQLGQLVAMAPFVSILILLVGCDENPITSITSSVEPAQPTGSCIVDLFPAYVPNQFYLVVDSTRLTLPARFNFTARNGVGVERSFWIGLRDRRDGVPSGALV